MGNRNGGNGRQNTMTYISRIIPAAFLLVLVAVACGTDDPQSDPSSGGGNPGDQSARSIDGDWLLIAGSIDGNPLNLKPDYDVTLTIAGTDIGGRAACNGYGGSAVIARDTFSIDGISMTEMGCEPSIMDLEATYAEALLRVGSATRTGEALRLTGDGIDLAFETIPPVATAELLGTVWVLDTIIEGDAASSTLVSADEATLSLAVDGTFTGSTGCRTISGDYVIATGSVQFTSWGAEGECPSELAAQDSQVITVLEGPFTVVVDGDRLTVTAPGGEALTYLSRG